MSMKSDIDIEMLLKYLDKNLTKEEEAILKEWLKANRSNKQRLIRLQKIWNTQDLPLPDPDMEQAWLNITDTISAKEHARKKTRTVKPISIRIPISWHFFRTKFAFAITLLFVVIISVLGIYAFLNHAQPIPMTELRINNAQQEIHLLPDGTRITLDAGSVFQYPSQFNAAERVVSLEGEGYFEVASDVDRPFILNTNNTVIEVLGTEFNVRAWQKDNKVTVAVVRGIVAFRVEVPDGSREEVILRDKQFSIMDKNNHLTAPRHWDGSSHLSWMKHAMYFQGVPLREVVDQLQRWYDVIIDLPDAQAAANRVTIFIDNRPLSELLDVIALLNAFEFQEHNGTIIFKRKH
jgi:transmembrane sensor